MGGDTQAGAENASEERPQNNPLSRKINKILETRLENDKVDMYMLYIFFFEVIMCCIELENLKYHPVCFLFF